MPVVGIPIPSYTLSDLSIKTISPREIFGEKVFGRRLGIVNPSGQSLTLDIVLVDDDGNIILVGDNTSIKIRYSEAIKFDRLIDETDYLGFDPDNGVVQLEVPNSIISLPGVYLCSVGIFLVVDSSNKLITTKNIWLYNEPSVWADNIYGCALPTWEELKLLLRDSSPVENELLDKLFYDVEEVAQAAVESVRYWNEVPPPITFHTTQTFPFGAIWRLGIRYYLSEIVLEWFRKNRLPYSAGGISVDDMNKLQEYAMVQQQVGNEFRSLVLRQKVRMNLSYGFGKIG
ncbi:MAG: hypothetical protein KatS3mg087_0091 [Patescibacteria group bacterium]|nr:MAG: hypothetical protein KatS3mg087_0091 [Patescibacteria group bacterium]